MLSSWRSWRTGKDNAAGENGVEPNLRSHIPALDAVRGLAIIAVTIYRFGGGSPSYASAGDHVLPLVSLGMRGVDLFFVLSGFLISGILYDAKEKSHYFRDFYARRTLRIFPLYYAVLIVALLLWPWHLPAQDYAPWLWLYGANVVQATDGWCLGWLNHLWSLAVEEHFYLVWPGVIYALSRGTAMRLCAALFVLSGVGRIACAVVYPYSAAPEVLSIFRLDGLVAGAYLALAARGEGGLRALVPAAKKLLVGSLLLAVPLALRSSRTYCIPETLWALASAALLVLVLTAAPNSWLARAGQSRWLHWFGKYSYGMYVYQNLLIPLLAAWITAPSLAQAFGSPVLGQLAYLMILSLATMLMAWLSWHLFEKHFLKLKKHFESSAKPACAATARVMAAS